MTTALVGLLGVALGLIVGFGYRFWATRRSELADALVAVTELDEAARRLVETTGEEREENDLEGLWEQKGTALIGLTTPSDYRLIAETVAAAASGTDGGVERLVGLTGGLRDLLWAEHQAFILTPYLRYFSGDTLSKRMRAVVGACASQRQDPR